MSWIENSEQVRLFSVGTSVLVCHGGEGCQLVSNYASEPHHWSIRNHQHVWLLRRIWKWLAEFIVGKYNIRVESRMARCECPWTAARFQTVATPQQQQNEVSPSGAQPFQQTCASQSTSCSDGSDFSLSSNSTPNDTEQSEGPQFHFSRSARRRVPTCQRFQQASTDLAAPCWFSSVVLWLKVAWVSCTQTNARGQHHSDNNAVHFRLASFLDT